MRQDYAEFDRQHAEILAIGTSSPGAFRKFWKDESIPFPGLSDPDKHVLDMYGQEFRLLKFGRMPALIVVDKSGYIRYAHYGTSAADIPDNRDILRVLGHLKEEGLRGGFAPPETRIQTNDQ